MSVSDSWRLAVGTLTALPVRPPRRVDPGVAGVAMVLAPVAAIPLGLLVALVGWGGRELELAPIGVAAVAVGALALGTRAFHLDGLADTADGLASSYERERALAVMRTGDTGPAGAAALVIVLAIQVGALTSLFAHESGPWLAGLLVCASRSTLTATCARGIPAARTDGLGAAPAGSVPVVVAVAAWAAITAVLCAAFATADLPWWRGLVCAGAALAVVAVLVHRAVKRLGGVSGDVYGAAIELSLAALLLSAT